MLRVASGLVLGGVILAAVVGAIAPASAESRDHACVAGAGCPEAKSSDTNELAAQTQTKRPRVTIYPRHVTPGPYAKRQCYSWLVTEYRVSGPVITPQMRCWWE